LANKEIKKCRVGYDRLSIDYRGNISLGCTTFGTIGYIKTDKIKDAWSSDKAQKIRKQMMLCTYPCTSNCNKELTLPQKIFLKNIIHPIKSIPILSIKQYFYNTTPKFRGSISFFLIFIATFAALFQYPPIQFLYIDW
jgi:hypothetical protein